MTRTLARRWALLLVGLAGFGVGIAGMVQSNLGLGPWDVLHQGLARQFGLPIGMVGILVGLPIMLAWWPLGERPGWGTPINIVLIGVLTDLTLAVLPPAANLATAALLLIGGILLVGGGTGLYLSAEMGAGPRDGLMLGIARRTGGSIRLVRTLIEVAALAAGWLLGGTVGVGTLAFAFGIGPVVQASLWAIQRAGRGVVAARPAETNV